MKEKDGEQLFLQSFQDTVNRSWYLIIAMLVLPIYEEVDSMKNSKYELTNLRLIFATLVLSPIEVCVPKKAKLRLQLIKFKIEFKFLQELLLRYFLCERNVFCFWLRLY